MAQSAIEQISDRKDGKESTDGRAVVAGGVALAVVAILFIAWAFFFLRQIQSGTQQISASGGIQDQFNFTSVQEAQQQLQNTYQTGPSPQLKQIRDEVNATGQNTMQKQQVYQPEGGPNAFIDASANAH